MTTSHAISAVQRHVDYTISYHNPLAESFYNAQNLLTILQESGNSPVLSHLLQVDKLRRAKKNHDCTQLEGPVTWQHVKSPALFRACLQVAKVAQWQITQNPSKDRLILQIRLSPEKVFEAIEQWRSIHAAYLLEKGLPAQPYPSLETSWQAQIVSDPIACCAEPSMFVMQADTPQPYV